MTTYMFDPGSGNWDSTFPVRQTDHEQLMSKTNFRTICDQADLSQTVPLGLQPLARNRLVPFSNADCRVIQKTAQTPGDAQQFRCARNIPGDLAQMHRTTFVEPNPQPDKVAHLGYSLAWSQFTNSPHLCIIELVDRHWITPFLKWFPQTNF